MSKTSSKKRAKSALTLPLCAVWLIAAAGALFALHSWTPGAQAMFASLQLEAPTVTQWFLPLGQWLTAATTNLLIAAGAVVLTLLPFLFGLRAKVGATFYGALALVGLLMVGGAWLGLKRPTERATVVLGATE